MSDRICYKLRKNLKGTILQRIFEAKLDAGCRILYTLRYAKAFEKETILVWYICKHDEVNKRKQGIEQSFSRGIKANMVQYQHDANEEDVVFLNPHANVPLKEYEVHLDEVRMLSVSDWTPPVRLTREEREIVEHAGTVTLLGRSGTGKTFCVCSRISLDHARNPEFRQLFISRTSQLCRHINKVMMKNTGIRGNLSFHTVSGFVKTLEAFVGIRSSDWSNQSFYSFLKFKVDFSKMVASISKRNRLKNSHRKTETSVIDSLTAWSQIRSFIKGSFSAVDGVKGALSVQEYLGLGQKQCRLNSQERACVYQIYEEYTILLKRRKEWDETDRIRVLYQRYKEKIPIERNPYDLIYVDEVQDMLQGEIALFVLATGKQPASLFLAGDSAQSISFGVHFRFQDARTVLYNMVPQEVPEKPLRLRWNYRSHSGILNLAKDVVELTTRNFPFSMDASTSDCGIVIGPKPEVCQAYTEERLIQVLRAAGSARILVQDPHDFDGKGWGAERAVSGSRSLIEQACKKGNFKEPLILTIIQSKGLEFAELCILNFFADMSSEKNRAWKLMISNHPSGINLERDLKLLYTAVTRCCSKLLFVETRRTDAADAYFKHLAEKQLTMNYVQPKSLLVTQRLSISGWRVRGLELMQNEDDDPIPNIELAIKCFRNAEDIVLESRAVNMLESIKLRSASEWMLLPQLISRCLKNGNFIEALDAVSHCCPESQIVEERIQLLFKKLINRPSILKSTINEVI